MEEALKLIGQYSSLICLVVNALRDGHVSEDELVAVLKDTIKDAMVRASDALVERELSGK